MEGPAFEFIDHTADIAVRLRAPSLAGLFEAGAWALTEALTDRAAVEAGTSRELSLEGAEADLLLADWLEELLFLFERDDLLVARADVRITEGERCALRAVVHGERRDPRRHPLKLLIKAVTYHGLRIERTGTGYGATIVFDI